MKDENIIEVKDLKKSFKNFEAVKGVTFEVKKGEIFGLLGPNGAGKTTTLEMIEGLQVPTSGSIILNGLNVPEEPMKVKHVIGVQLQSSAFYEKLSLVEILVLFGKLYGREVDAMSLLDKVELRDKAKSQVKTLSGGQKQRFSIASALVNDPVVIFLDEPTTGLDPQARRHLWSLITTINNEGKTIVLTTHYMDEAELLCNRIAIMDSGQIISLDTPNNMIDKLIASGFKKEKVEKLANLEDVFIDLTGKQLREE